MKEISVSELKQKMDGQEDFQLIDIREDYELDICTIGGEHIPMAEVSSQLDRIRKDVPVYIHCRSGSRSAAVTNMLEEQFSMTNVYNVAGGILAYADEVDTSLEKY